ncbi:RNA polymerase sporulation sigma factor SigK [Garciella nitratireducens]|uniref:RNA polymerase sporulation sigma factor SigK n=1 Tax=Garciella nitratireducens TaxID=218205 RepID=UPI000DE97A4B|nr:RNA polymerase sporulation sigma factor SigK [Garciella nitratireducens]RBP46683.1 RNA polymerase sigma-27/28 (RpsK/SigK) subunit [Garciella nitratireducens]
MLSAALMSIAILLKDIYFIIGYVGNGNSFPKPLSPEEERKYLQLYKQGDEKAKSILIEHNLRLVAHIVKKYNGSGRDIDDLISIGTVGLIKGISTYDMDKSVKLATYAARCIENEILMSIRADQKIKNEISLQDPIGIDKEGNEITLIDILGSEADEIINTVEFKIEASRLYNLMERVLKKREKTILELRYGLHNGVSKTQREIAKMLGISRSYVSRIEKRAIKKLSKEFQINSCQK